MSLLNLAKEQGVSHPTTGKLMPKSSTVGLDSGSEVIPNPAQERITHANQSKRVGQIGGVVDLDYAAFARGDIDEEEYNRRINARSKIETVISKSV